MKREFRIHLVADLRREKQRKQAVSIPTNTELLEPKNGTHGKRQLAKATGKEKPRSPMSN